MGLLEMVTTRKMEVTAELRRVPHPGAREMAGRVPGGIPTGRSNAGVAELKPERVQEWLTARPGWRESLEGRVLQRVSTFPSSESAALYSAFVASLAASLALPVKARVDAQRVELYLPAPRHGNRFMPLTEAVLDLGARIG